jgi:hypothetical membrane protein
MVRKILLGCGIVSSVLYVAADIFASLLYPGYRYTEQQFSELTAVGSPVRPLMIALSEFPYTLLVGAFGVGVWASASRRRAGRITGALLVGYALTGVVAGVFFPMDRREVLATGERTLHNAIHGPGTAVSSLFIVLAMVFGSTLLGRRFRYYSYATIITVVVFGVLTSLQIGQMEANQPTPWMGITERISIYGIMLWVAVLTIGLLRAQQAR